MACIACNWHVYVIGRNQVTSLSCLTLLHSNELYISKLKSVVYDYHNVPVALEVRHKHTHPRSAVLPYLQETKCTQMLASPLARLHIHMLIYRNYICSNIYISLYNSFQVQN